MKKFHMRPGPYNVAGLFFALTGFLLVFLCLIGCVVPSGRGLYFAKVTDAQVPANGSRLSVYYGWQAYCLEETELNCYIDRDVMVVPFDDSIATQLNETYPRLFTDPITQDAALNPESEPSPAHDPRIYPASVICLICSAILLMFCFMRVFSPRRYQDIYYTRGFLAAGCTVLALLLVILSSLMYQEAVDQLNKEYPHLIASEGPCMIMIGVAFASFMMASYCLLRGSMSMDNNVDTEGYNPI